METPPGTSQYVSQHLANERTYLAWLRTSFSLLTLGFATNKFGQFLVELHMNSDQEIPPDFLSGSRRFGLVMVIFGTVLMAIASWNYQRTRKGIKAGDYHPASLLIWIVSIMSVLFGITAVVLLLQT